jgi:uncharacterized OsmC-like protein
MSPNASAVKGVPAPHELFPAALAACVATTLVMYARTKEWDLGDVTVDVDYDHRSTPRVFEVGIRLTGELSDAQLERLEKVAAACPLRRSIESGIEFVERMELRRERALRRDLVRGRRPIASRKQIVVLGGRHRPRGDRQPAQEPVRRGRGGADHRMIIR